MAKEGSGLVTFTRKEVLEALAKGQSLAGKDMRKANLSKLDFTGVDCKFANFSYANVKDCVFVRTDLANASFWNASCEGANFTAANLEDADLDYAKLRGAILYQANIRRASLPIETIPRDDIMSSVDKGTPVGHFREP
jgi:uncharacterized protein YjbI with pentapeptide repeats